jgi:DNA-binding PadR family transcriptional regulator
VLHNNSLYLALKRSEEAGAVTRTAEPQEGRPPRLVYH